MELSDLRIFQAVVRAGGITRAATQLIGAVEHHDAVKQLEEKLGVALFMREGKRLQLTPAGMVLLDYADRLLALRRKRGALLDQTPRGCCGSARWKARRRAPARSLSDYHRRYPEVTLNCIRQPAAAFGARAGRRARSRADHRAGAGRPFESLALYDEELVIVAAVGDRGSPRRAI